MPPGRKTLCTPELTAEIRDYIVQGLSNKDACALAGINESTFYLWLNEGEKGKSPYLEFLESIKSAVPSRKKELLNKIAQAGRDHWQAFAWLLERLHPSEFALTKRRELIVTGPDGGPIELQHLTDSEVVREFTSILAAGSTAEDQRSGDGGEIPLDAQGETEATSS